MLSDTSAGLDHCAANIGMQLQRLQLHYIHGTVASVVPIVQPGAAADTTANDRHWFEQMLSVVVFVHGAKQTTTMSICFLQVSAALRCCQMRAPGCGAGIEALRLARQMVDCMTALFMASQLDVKQ